MKKTKRKWLKWRRKGRTNFAVDRMKNSNNNKSFIQNPSFFYSISVFRPTENIRWVSSVMFLLFDCLLSYCCWIVMLPLFMQSNTLAFEMAFDFDRWIFSSFSFSIYMHLFMCEDRLKTDQMLTLPIAGAGSLFIWIEFFFPSLLSSLILTNQLIYFEIKIK